MTTNWLKDLKPRANSIQTFKSYLPTEDVEHSSKKIHSNPTFKEKKEIPRESSQLQPMLLPGEVVISQAENVLKFNTLSDLNKGITGLLVCTNFKVSFLTAENFVSNLHQKNLLLGEHDICLINIDNVYQINNGKRKKLSVSCTSANVEILEICCKDFRIYTFSFKFSPIHQRSVINTIIHHSFVPRINLLFVFDYKEPSSKLAGGDEEHSLRFTGRCDWEAELERCRCPGWRVTLGNEKFLLCESLPESFVVPSILLDMNLNRSAPHFSGHRVPVWSWGRSSGASVVRMAALDPSISDSRQKDVMVDAISRASPHQTPVRVFDLDDLCPSYKELQNSFLKLKELCMPSTPNEFWERDSNYLSSLESTKWLQYVGSCLRAAIEGAKCILADTTVILSEHEGRDTSAVVSSLIQLMVDPTYRSRSGFQQLIQKEWVALGHPFTERHKLISGFESEESPVFLLFLDCVWQLSEQCPTQLEFSETYLTTLWDGTRLSLFDTFLFSSHKCRTEATRGGVSNFKTRSLWKWERMFNEKDIRLFSNPLFILNKYATKDGTSGLCSNDMDSSASLYEKRTSLSRVGTSTYSSKEGTSSYGSKDVQLTSLSGRRTSTSFSKSGTSTTSSVDSPSSSRDVTPSVPDTSSLQWNSKEENLLEVDPHLKSLKLWHQCYMRWIPVAHTLSGGRPVLFLSHLKICAEIEDLEKEIKALAGRGQRSRHRRVASDDYTLAAEKVASMQIPEGSSIVSSVFPFAPVAPWDWNTQHFVPSTSYLQISYTGTEELVDD